jgi:sulfate adenylyltransferase subunit 2
MYEFRDRLAREWGLDLRVASNSARLAEGMGPQKGTKLECCTELKTNALKEAVASLGLQAIFLGIRRDEHGIRAKERYFSPRDSSFRWNYDNQPAELWDQFQTVAREEEHFRVHPILHFTELDVWEYIQRERMPVTSLYFSREGRRYRSIGCAPCCAPVASEAATVEAIIEELRTSTESERAGRIQDKESLYTMQKLRSLGYM